MILFCCHLFYNLKHLDKHETLKHEKLKHFNLYKAILLVSSLSLCYLKQLTSNIHHSDEVTQYISIF